MEDFSVGDLDERNLKTKRLIYWVLALLEVLFAFRLLFKLMGANPGSPFVSFIYTVSQVFIMPFVGIFRSTAAQGIETRAILEPGTIIAMIVYALIAWGIVKLIEIYRTQ